jgi:type II secretory pathway component PulK
VTTIQINRAPVMTLWAAVVAERLGYTRDEALTLGRAVAGMNAQAKAVRIGLREPAEAAKKGEKGKRPASKPGSVLLLGRNVPVVKTPDGVRTLSSAGKPDSPEAVERYLEGKFGDALNASRAAMKRLAAAFPPDELAEQAYALYEKFRPQIPTGTRGWGAKGVLDLEALAMLAPGTRRKTKS